ncbi:hypothetical protein Q8A67_014186 [Cirrhinus molitorella]|uniref:Uncharacterized protein n=1 Tax=Cirrhinus molitorella TaxID=172907 RepID=A0AA88PUV6_9TELE|nr:hypothetical protein Q8A67_014186 [Cirrhinus molitorella]
MADGRKDHKAQPDLSDTTNTTAITRTHRSHPTSREEVNGPFKVADTAVEQYVADEFPADPPEWQPERAGCGTAHGRRQALQVPAATPAFQTDGF